MSQDSPKKQISWGTDESYFGINLRPAYLDAKDRELIQNLTPSERLEWLLMMQKLIVKQFKLDQKKLG